MKIITNKKDRHLLGMKKEIDRLKEENEYLQSILKFADIENVNKKMEESKQVQLDAMECIKQAKQAKRDYEKLTLEFELMKKQFLKDLKKSYK